MFFSQKVWQYYSSSFEDGNLLAVDGCQLRYVRGNNKDAGLALVVLGGRTEFCEKYAELFCDLNDIDCCIYSCDHRGQGLSQRLLDDPLKGHVAHFEDYTHDLARFLGQFVANSGHRKVVLLGHSMGGTIAVDYVSKYRGSVDGVILCSPMFGIDTSPLPETIARAIVKMAVTFGLGENYIDGRSQYEPSKTFVGNKLTSSEQRFQTTQDLFAHFQRAQLAGPTYGWVSQSFVAMERVIAHASAIAVPVLLLQAGDDRVVVNHYQDVFNERCLSCTLIRIPEARHEILMERDLYRDQALRQLRDFLLHI